MSLLWKSKCLLSEVLLYQVGVYLFKVNNENTKTICEINDEIKLTEQHQRAHSGILIVNFDHISHFFQFFYFLLWTNKMYFREKYIPKYSQPKYVFNLLLFFFAKLSLVVRVVMFTVIWNMET